jgi:hypothetical protein
MSTYPAARTCDHGTLPPGVERDGDTWTVHPHGAAPDDPQRIQAAVDMAGPGDTIRLAAGVFDFGDFGNVRIAKDLTLEGAWDEQAGAPATTIRHGAWPLLVGRRTPAAQPPVRLVAGHEVWHITADLFGRVFAPVDYPPYTEPGAGAYDAHTDWVAVELHVRQIRFERPYGAAIWSGGQQGGTFERLHIASAWPMQTEALGGKPLGFGIFWAGPGWLPVELARRGWSYDERLYMDTELVRGDRVVQDCVIAGDFAAFAEGAPDEAGAMATLPYDPDSPMPPGGDYAAYVLQDVPFAWDAAGRPLADKTRLYWVRKGYTAKYFTWLPVPQVYGLRGIYAGVYSLWTEGALTLRQNTLERCDTGFMLLGNGYRGRRFTTIIERNAIDLAAATDFHFEQAALFAHDYALPNPFTGEPFVPAPGMDIEFTDNGVTRRRASLGWSTPALDLGAYGSTLIEGNEIEIASGAGVWVWRSPGGASIEWNRILGRGAYALAANSGANGNTLRANNLSEFEPTGAGIPLDPPIPPAGILLLADGNTVSGGWDHEPDVTVLDYGLDNIITGMARQVGRPLNAAERELVSRRGVPVR